MFIVRRHRTKFVMFSAFLLFAGLAASSIHARSKADAACHTTFVEITPAARACGFSLSKTGVLIQDGKTLADPLVASYQDDGSSQKPLGAEEVVLFPPSPSGRFRILQACTGMGAEALCWQTFVLDQKKGQLHNSFAGRYGPRRWQSWSPNEQHVVLANSDEGAWWLHVIEPANGNSLDFPADGSTENWIVEPKTLTWTGPRSFTIRVKTCGVCKSGVKEIQF
ncbi:hypothetical protein DUT91_17175 [Phyllobacterium salinisoli]|uniref:Uncharacterized protein n=1 Tax=Phyllobacterium salinisoli TaxID=1899321 RepID=A0A368K0C1_9HYPH|nr:hypothetical protein [Phyllobacterium salinisoli]RCS22614.1 hypothetical protein DUT91_17175 [Phyllobacterium salinisoli]